LGVNDIARRGYEEEATGQPAQLARDRPDSDPNPSAVPDAVTEPDVHANRHPNRNSNTDLDAGAVAQLRR
jgi:hypothetical protein